MAGARQSASDHGAVGPEQLVPAVDGAWNGDGMNAAGCDAGEARGPEPVGIGGPGRPPGGVQALHLAIRRADQGKAVPADTGHGRLDDAEHRRGRDSGIHRIASCLEAFHRGQRGHRGGSRGHAGRRIGGGASGSVESTHEWACQRLGLWIGHCLFLPFRRKIGCYWSELVVIGRRKRRDHVGWNAAQPVETMLRPAPIQTPMRSRPTCPR